jgi:hypothetical protein
VTRNLDIVTQNFDFVTWNFDFVIQNFYLLTRNFDIVTRNFDLFTRNFDWVTLLEWQKKYELPMSLDNIRYSKECDCKVEIENRVHGKSIEVNLKLIIVVNFDNGMYTPDIKNTRLPLICPFRRCIVIHLFEHIFSLIILFTSLWIKRSYTSRLNFVLIKTYLALMFFRRKKVSQSMYSTKEQKSPVQLWIIKNYINFWAEISNEK